MKSREVITSLQNPRVKAAARLRDRQGRDDQGRIIIDGVREIGLALAAKVKILELYCFSGLCSDDAHRALMATAEKQGAEIVEVAPHVMEKLSFGQRVEGVVAVAEPPRRKLSDLQLGEIPLIAVVEGVEKPGNVGAIVRTADAAGVSAVIVTDGKTDLYNPNAIRASLGAIFSVPICGAAGEETLSWLRDQKCRLLATRVDGVKEYTQADFRGSVAIILGSEAHGLSGRWRSADIISLHLPMLGRVDSLNLSATAAILFYEALRQRRGG
jgi:TrmH family RNA methyltransferase